MMYYVRVKDFIARLQQQAWYAGLLIVLALLGGLALSYEWWPGRDEALFHDLLRLDFYIACFFLLDFLLGLLVCSGYPSRTSYLRQNWTNLVSSIPVTTELTQFLRLLRIWRAWRVFKMGIGVWSMRRFLRRSESGELDKV